MESGLAIVPEGSTREETIAFLRAQMAEFSTMNSASISAPSNAISATGAWEEILGSVGLPCHKVTQIEGSLQGLMGCIAGVSAADHTVALVGFPEASWSAAYELGAKLENLVWVPHPGPDCAGIAMVLATGFDLVVVDFSDVFLTPQKVQRYESKIRKVGGTLLVANCVWPQAAAHISTKFLEAEGMRQGYGRISTLTFQVEVRNKQRQCRAFQWTIGRPFYDVALPIQRAKPLHYQSQRVALPHVV